ncbi:MAG: 1-aminocyclopropane-1-carboxylate deaminase/D-cysteine desulfhydrase, partial [Gammaproteobacteria bacterium]
LSLGCRKVVSMGGAYSNHLHALAYVGRRLALATEGWIRGEARMTPTLADARRWGMVLRFVSRSEYRNLREYKSWNSLPGFDPETYWLPEGGASALALRGVSELVDEIDIGYDTLCVPCGTGTTLAGIVGAVAQGVKVYGIAALKGGNFLARDVERLLTAPYDNWSIFNDYHFGGFAVVKPELTAFIERFSTLTGIPLEPVYTGKMLYGIYDMIAKGRIASGRRIIALHTGGLQGNRGFAA